VAHSDDKRAPGSTSSAHLLGRIPYEEVRRKKIVLPKRQPAGAYRSIDYPFKYIPERF
jgi:hypothetical protein